MDKTALLLAPHPDDESIVGLLALRLRDECGFRIQVVPATLGSRVERRAARQRELQAACAALGFQPIFLDPAHLQTELAKRLRSRRAGLVIMPHARDGHPRHRATHWLGVAAMDAAGGVFHVVETEYWHPLARPNLLVAASRAHLAALRRALRCHRGELARNDYAARLPAWMSDNVRRGAELLGGAGSAAPRIAHATLYRARIRAGGKWHALFRGGRIVQSASDLAALAAAWK